MDNFMRFEPSLCTNFKFNQDETSNLGDVVHIFIDVIRLFIFCRHVAGECRGISEFPMVFYTINNQFINLPILWHKRIVMRIEVTDIRHRSDEELSLLFLNDEGLYREFMEGVKSERFNDIQDLCDKLFVYTEEQLEDLVETFWAEI